MYCNQEQFKLFEITLKYANHPFHIITNQTNIGALRKRGASMFFLILLDVYGLLLNNCLSVLKQGATA